MSDLKTAITDIFGKAGLNAAEILGENTSKFDGIALTPEQYNILSSKLLNLDSAKQHPEVSSHFKKSYFGKIDTTLEEELKEQGFDDNAIAELKKESTEQRIKSSLKKLAELKSQTNKATTNEEITRLQTALQTLQQQREQENLLSKNQLAETTDQIKKLKTDFGLDRALSAYNLRKDLSAEQVNILAKTEIQKKLSELEAVLVIDDLGKISLKSSSNPENNYFDTKTNKTLTTKEFLDNVIANSGLQEVAKAGNNNQNNNQNVNVGNQYINPNAKRLAEKWEKEKR
jgi:glycerophosphoryl diester phosphodiesterase